MVKPGQHPAIRADTSKDVRYFFPSVESRQVHSDAVHDFWGFVLFLKEMPGKETDAEVGVLMYRGAIRAFLRAIGAPLLTLENSKPTTLLPTSSPPRRLSVPEPLPLFRQAELHILAAAHSLSY